MASNQQRPSQKSKPENPFLVDPSATRDSFKPPLVLSGKNDYSKWYRAMSVALASKIQLGFLDGKIEAPAKDHATYGAWNRTNELVLSWIVKAVSAEIGKTIDVGKHDKAASVWRKLMERFSHGEKYIISDLLEEIYSLRQQKRTVERYFDKFCVLWKELETLRPLPVCTRGAKCSCCGALRKVRKQREEEKVVRFLKGLNDQFRATKSRIMREDPLPSLNKVYDSVVKEAAQMASAAQPQQGQGVKQRQNQQLSTSKQGITPTKPPKDVTKIEKRDLPWHPHPLTLKPPGSQPSKCSGCRELVFGSSYRCEEKRCNYVLHEDCANIVAGNSGVSHPFFKGSNFEFVEKKPDHWHDRYCDACGNDVRGFFYRCYRTRKDLHPCCLKLKGSVSDEGGHVTLKLCETVPKKCLICKGTKVENNIKGWSYVTSDGEYCCHVSCFKKSIIRPWDDGYFSKTKMSVHRYDTKTQLPLTGKEMDVKVGGSNKKMDKVGGISKGAKVWINIAAVTLKLIFSIVFGNPAPLLAHGVEALLNLIIN